MRSPVLKRLVAGAASAGVVAVGVTVLSASPAAAAADPFTVKLSCNTLPFDKQFTWDVTVTPTFTGTGATQELVIELSDMPGLSPAPVNGTVTGTMDLTVADTAVTVEGDGPAVAAPDSPIPLMPLTGAYTGSVDNPAIEVSTADFVVSASGVVVDVNCVKGDVPPTTPPTTPPPPTTPAPKPTDDADDGDKKGVPATGTVKFTCTLETLGSPFTYDPKVTMSGSRAEAGDSKVNLRATFSDIPGLAPLPIENGKMKITAAAEVGGKKVNFSSTSTVNAPMYGEVPVPTQTASITTDEDELAVEITAFKFDFGVMAGLEVYSNCKGGGKIGTMTVGIGDDDGAGGGGGAASASSADTLPKTGAGAPLVMIGLWSSALVLLAIALFLYLPRRSSRTET